MARVKRLSIKLDTKYEPKHLKKLGVHAATHPKAHKATHPRSVRRGKERGPFK